MWMRWLWTYVQRLVLRLTKVVGCGTQHGGPARSWLLAAKKEG
jgi:hypothetical protein